MNAFDIPRSGSPYLSLGESGEHRVHLLELLGQGYVEEAASRLRALHPAASVMSVTVTLFALLRESKKP